MKRVSRIVIDGREDPEGLKLSIKALLRSGGETTIACTPLRDDHPLLKGVTKAHTIPLLSSVREYSLWLLKHATEFINDEFALFVQHDGFVVHPDRFDEEFLNYDYIGAPWPQHFHQNRGRRVGNGGFSLRSKKFLDLCSKIDFSKASNDAEDFMVCVEFREELEKAGMLFAPLEVAAKFSLENRIEDFDNYGIRTFGFHGRTNIVTQQYSQLLC